MQSNRCIRGQWGRGQWGAVVNARWLRRRESCDTLPIPSFRRRLENFRTRPAMESQVFLITVFGMGAVSVIAALTAIVLLFRHLARGKMLEQRPAVFTFAANDPAPSRPPAARPPEPSAPPRLSLFLFAEDAPDTIRIPVKLTKGRILEINLPLGVSWTGGRDLEEVAIRIDLPNAITYGASLEHMLQAERPSGLLQSTISYASAHDRTAISILAQALRARSETSFAVPISLTQMTAPSHQIRLAARGPGLEPIERTYILELYEDADADPGQSLLPGSWTCRPEDGQRVRDPHLPLDRVTSTLFTITRH